MENMDPDAERDLRKKLFDISISTMDVSVKSGCKEEVQNHPYLSSLRQVLQNLQDSSGLNYGMKLEDDQQDPQLMRLDNMLVAEGVITEDANGNPLPMAVLGSVSPSEGIIENQEYKTKLAEIKMDYKLRLDGYREVADKFKAHCDELITKHGDFRPIDSQRKEQMLRIINKKLSRVIMAYKQQCCEMVMVQRSRFLDARRKRRNFSRQATDVLNQYFYAKLENPYPSEETKEELAQRCGISVAQVSNWFGNKRIRYKKNITRSQEEANMYAARQASGEYEAPSSSHSSANLLSPAQNGSGGASQDEWATGVGNQDYGHQYYSDGSED